MSMRDAISAVGSEQILVRCHASSRPRIRLSALVLAALVLGCVPWSAQADIDACATPIGSNTIWSPGEVYEAIDCNIEISLDETLTLQPGVIIKFGGMAPGSGAGPNNVGLIVDGTLNVLGTAAQPVVFTSYRDDSYGGDSNGDGSSTGVAGDWRGILIRDVGTVTIPVSGVANLDQFIVSFAGSPAFTPGYGRGRGQIELIDGSLSLTNGEISNGITNGVYLEGDGITPTLTDLRIANNVDPGAADGEAVRQHTVNMQPNFARLTLEGNERDLVVIDQFNGALTQDVTLGGANFGTDCGFTLCVLTIPDGLSLTVEPGVTIDFEDVHKIAANSGSTFTAEGTAMAPIVFTSSKAEAGTAGGWQGIVANAGSQLSMAHCEVAYTSLFARGGLEIGTDDAVVMNCRLHDNVNDGLVLYTANPNSATGIELQDLTLEDNGRFGLWANSAFATNIEFMLERATIRDNGGSGILLDSRGSGSSIDATIESVILTRNGSNTGLPDGDRHALRAQGETNFLKLSSLTLTDNALGAALINPNATIDANGWMASGNDFDGLTIAGGGVFGGKEWTLSDIGVPIHVSGGVTVATGAFLTISPGTELLFAPGQRLYANEGTIFALGTAANPILFAATTPGVGNWTGIEILGNSASAYLRHCEIRDANKGIFVGSGDQVIVQNCRIHDNNRGMEVRYSPTIIRANQFYDNVEVGVGSTFGAQVDARLNYWGAPSGPFHPTTNPEGMGDTVWDLVLYDPWLDQPPDPDSPIDGGVVVTTGSPDFVSPGESAEFAIQYLNLSDQPLNDAVAVLQLPYSAGYVDSSHGGRHWIDRGQVVWPLGDVEPGSTQRLSATVEFDWGLPQDYEDGTITLLAAENYQQDLFSAEELAAYQNYEYDPLIDYVSIPETAALADPDLSAAISDAATEGFVFFHAADLETRSGAITRAAILINEARLAVRLLSLEADGVYAIELDPNRFILTEPSGGTMSLDLVTGAQSSAGAWALRKTEAACTKERCFENCRSRIFKRQIIRNTAGRIVFWMVLGFKTGGISVVATFAVETYQFFQVVKMTDKCRSDCNTDPTSHCCTADQTLWGTGLRAGSCAKWSCSPVEGNWIPAGDIDCKAGEQCVPGIGEGKGCVGCSLDSIKGLSNSDLQAAFLAGGAAACKAATEGDQRCTNVRLRVARDPNDITGAEGDLFPGQQVTYTIRYENVGQGRAYGVYIVNPLPAEFDPATLVINDGGLLAGNDLIWLVGELGPSGDPDAEGAVSYQVNVATGLPSGTVIANQATVYFPSVPEETPTNTWVNQIAPLAAIPQSVTTSYETSAPIVLEGREVSSLPLTFEIERAPGFGLLSGTPPDLVYTPIDGAVGIDTFRFTVDNGTSRSRPASVVIEITPDGDADPPTVVHRRPAENDADVGFSRVALRTDDSGAVYEPIITMILSEPLDPATLSDDAVSLEGPAAAVPVTVAFDPSGNRLSLLPRQPLASDTVYTVTLLAGMTDLAGNPLATDTWGFATRAEGIFVDGFEAPPARILRVVAHDMTR